MKRLRDRWRGFWFAPASPTDLGVCRMLFYGAFFLYYLPLDDSAWASVSQVFWMPTTFFRLLHLPVLPATVLVGLQSLWKAALLLSCVGLYTRLSTAVACGLGFYLLGLPHNFGSVLHYDTLVVWVLSILALSCCGDGWSLDRLIAVGRRGDAQDASVPRRSGEYTWPIRAVWLVMALIFFGAGVSKLRYGGLGWIFSGNLAIVLIQHNYRIANADPLLPWGLVLARHPWVCRALAGVTVTGEFFYPLVLISRRARWVLVPTVFGMQVGIRVLMGPTFNQYLLCNLFWIPWSRLGAYLSPMRLGSQSAAVFFDGGCGLCRRTVAVIRRLDLLGRLEYCDVLTGWTEIEARFPQLSQAQCLADMHLVTRRGKITVGFDVYREIAWGLPVGWLLLPVLYLPGVRPIGRRVYAAVAANRVGMACTIPGSAAVVSDDGTTRIPSR